MSTTNKSLKELLAEFDELVAWFDGDDLDVDMAIAKFEEGNKLSEEIKKKLNEAKNKIEVVKAKFDIPSGAASDLDATEDFDDEENVEDD
ncbi:MAG: exodeoxyribonuclease VII small subunit [Candidatus Nomurabacteria bacterium]|jgi:exodeoxyribonuclease VII small subunit|nr:exodeoxyribonuclease VII small subunit [Candidatus Nomurabacteria bacterium]